MLDITEYKDYITANKDFLTMLKDKQSLIYDRFQDILKVLGYIDLILDKYGNIEEEFEVFYEVGYSFLYDQLEEVKYYYKHYFQKQYPLFKEFETLINYSLYLDDYHDALKEAELLNPDITQAIRDIQAKIVNILENKLSFSEDIFDEFNAILSSEIYFKRRVLTTTEVFERIVEELVL